MPGAGAWEGAAELQTTFGFYVGLFPSAKVQLVGLAVYLHWSLCPRHSAVLVGCLPLGPLLPRPQTWELEVRPESFQGQGPLGLLLAFR